MEIDDIGYSVVTAFSRVTSFISSLFGIVAEQGQAKMDKAEKGKSGRLFEKRGDPTIKYAVFKIVDNLTIRFRIPNTLSFENGNLFALDINQITINEINNSNIGYKLSLTQYFKYEQGGENNSVVIDLIINNNEHRYICVNYNREGNIQTEDYNTYTDYNTMNRYYAGIVPDPNARRRRTENKYNYDAQREDYIERNQNAEKTIMNAAVASSPAKYSQYSPVDKKEGVYHNLSIEAKMNDLHIHGVEGIGTIAANRYVVSTGDTRFSGLVTVKESTSIKDQLGALDTVPEIKREIKREIKMAQATRDLVDVAHDFRTIPKMNEFVNIIKTGEDTQFEGDLNKKIVGLLTTEHKIHVANSHQIQKNNIRNLEQHMRNKKLNFPDIPRERYVSRDYVFAMFVIDMMNTTNEKQVRRNYSESGKQVTIKTFREYYESLDDAEKDIFDLYVVKIMGNADRRNAPIKDLASYDKEYPSISKKIYLDGCTTGPVINDDTPVDTNITNVYGHLNVRLQGNNKNGFTITISDKANPPNTILRLITPKDFRITYDNVANFISSTFGLAYPTRRNSEDTNITDKGPRPNLTFGTTNSRNLKILASMCLKTFCDKLYRTEHGGTNPAELVTHICTTDSYVYADPIIEYLAGNAPSIPTIMRSGDERSTGEETAEPPPDTCELGSMGLSGRGFYIQPGVNSSSYIDTNYAQILKKTLGYAGILQHLFNETHCNLAEPGSPSSGERTTQNKMKNIFFHQCYTLFSTTVNTLGSLVKPMPSYRFINFVERIICNTPSPDSVIQINTDSYETIITYLFNLEYNSIVENVKGYIKTLSGIMQMNLTNIDGIKAKIIQLPDLEELLTMSTPAFCDENDDSLIVYKDKIITEDNSPYWQIDQHEVGAEKRVNTPDENPTFNNVTFSSKGIQITGCNDVFKQMVYNQINKEYTLSGETITGPITLGLLCELKKLNTNPAVLTNIDNEITNIITNFCKTRDLKPDACVLSSASVDTSKKATPILVEQAKSDQTNAKLPQRINDEIMDESMSSDGSRQSANATPNYRQDTASSKNKRRTRRNEAELLSSSSTTNRETKRRRIPPWKGGSRRHKKASRKRNGRKILHRTRKYKHH